MKLNVLEESGVPVRRNCPLAPLSSFRIGGTAEIAAFPQTRGQLLACLCAAREERLPFETVGNGTNLLFPDGIYPGMIIFTKGVRDRSIEGTCVRASAGVPLPELARAAAKEGLSGLEFAQGIPGTVGGGVFMNAGAYGGCMGEITVRSEWYDCETGSCGYFAGAEQRFGTRTSMYEQNSRYIILGAELCLHPNDPARIRARMEAYREKRHATQPVDLPSAGSVFRHPPGTYAGKLIEDCGLKGTRVGGAEVSQKHAGFIVNRGGATAGDVLALIGLIRERVLRETGYRLECEVRTVGNRADRKETKE